MKPLLSPAEIESLRALVREAGLLALRLQKDTQSSRKQDCSIVTAADFAVQEFLIERISKVHPGLVFVGEENFDKNMTALRGDAVSAIIDPIDGTAMYTMHLPFWCVSMGIFEGTVPRYGFVYSPGSDLFFYNDDEHAYLNDTVTTAEPELTIDCETNILYASEIQRHFTIDFIGKVRNLGSTALQACLAIDNRRNRTVAFIGRSYLWDWAGAIPIVLKGGACLRYIDGRPLDCGAIMENQCVLRDFLLAYSGVPFEQVRGFFREIQHTGR